MNWTNRSAVQARPPPSSEQEKPWSLIAVTSRTTAPNEIGTSFPWRPSFHSIWPGHRCHNLVKPRRHASGHQVHSPASICQGPPSNLWRNRANARSGTKDPRAHPRTSIRTGAGAAALPRRGDREDECRVRASQRRSESPSAASPAMSPVGHRRPASGSRIIGSHPTMAVCSASTGDGPSIQARSY